MPFVDISGVDIYSLFHLLWSESANVRQITMVSKRVLPPPTREEIDQALSRGDVDYFHGAAFKLDLSDLTAVDPHFYNRDNGDGKFESIVAQLKAN